MIEKVLPFILTITILTLGISGAGSGTIAVIPDKNSAESVYTQIMDSIGPDLAARAQEAGFNLDISVACYSGSGAALNSISVELRSAIGTAMYGSNTVDWELMRDIQLAVIDSGVFELTPDEIETARSTYYTPDHHNDDIDFASGVNLHINETPFGYEAILYLRHNSSFSDYTFEYSVSFDWNGVTYDSRS